MKMIDVYVELENILWENKGAENSQGNECTFTITVFESEIFRNAVCEYLLEKTGYKPMSWNYAKLKIVRERY